MSFCDKAPYNSTCHIPDLSIEFNAGIDFTVKNKIFPDEPLIGVVFTNCTFKKKTTEDNEVSLNIFFK